MRAAAAERRLANLAGPSNLVKMDPDSDDEVDISESGEEQPDVKDPHIATDQRKRDMEAEMDEQERQGLRGGWEDYVKTEPDLIRPPKRQLDEEESRSEPPTKKPPNTRPTFGKDTIKQETLRGTGLAQTTLSKTSRLLGGRSTRDELDVTEGLKTAATDDSRWECKLCTFVNIADHGRCGESRVDLAANSLSDGLDICQARPDGTLPDGVIV
jgi:hypothetical protein